MQPATLPYVIGVYDYYGLTYQEAFEKYNQTYPLDIHATISNGWLRDPDEMLYTEPDDYIKYVMPEIKPDETEREFCTNCITYFMNKDNDTNLRAAALSLMIDYCVARKKQDKESLIQSLDQS